MFITIQLRTVQCSAVQCSAVQCSAVQCSAVQCSAAHYNTVMHSTSTVQYSGVKNRWSWHPGWLGNCRTPFSSSAQYETWKLPREISTPSEIPGQKASSVLLGQKAYRVLLQKASSVLLDSHLTKYMLCGPGIFINIMKYILRF